MEDRKELVVGGYRFDRLSDAGEAALEIEKATYFEQRISKDCRRFSHASPAAIHRLPF